MSIQSEKFMERVKGDQCPICFKEVTKTSRVVTDLVFGDVSICEHHPVNISEERVVVKNGNR